jgi:hypothetical protein
MRTPAWTLWLSTALVAALLIVPLPIEPWAQRWPALTTESKNLAHPVACGLLAHLAFGRARLRWPAPTTAPYFWVMGGIACLGLLTEALQGRTGRETSWGDVTGNLLGSLVTLLLHARAEQRLAISRLAMGIGATLAASAAVAPLVLTLLAYAHRSLQVPVLWKDDSVLSGYFAHWHQGNYAALVLTEPISDWQEWNFLEIDLKALPSDMQVIVRVHDRQHDQSHEDRFNESFTLLARERTLLRIPLTRIREGPDRRVLDLSNIAGVVVFAPEAAPARELSVHTVRLSR